MMAYGDTGGSVTELIVTMVAGDDIQHGDALKLTGRYTVSREFPYSGDSIYGQAIASAHKGEHLPVKVRGIAKFRCRPLHEWGPSVGGRDGKAEIMYGSCSARWGDHGEVRLFNDFLPRHRPEALVLQYDADKNVAHVLL